MAKIAATDVAKLRKMTGAGMMDCKKALTEAEGDFEKAQEIIRKKGQAIANKRADREATEGCIIAAVNGGKNRGAVVTLNCETDFVAKNEDFVKLTRKIAEIAVEANPASLEDLKGLDIDGRKVGDVVAEQTGIIGEKIELSAYDIIEAEDVTAYVHPGNKIATLVGINKAGLDVQVGKDIAMQVAAMNPVSLSEDDVPAEVKEKELEIGRDQARQEGKPEQIIEKIAMGKLNKFFKESTLLNQAFIKDSKSSVKAYLQGIDKEATITSFKRFSLGE